jgi:hypothetical protein
VGRHIPRLDAPGLQVVDQMERRLASALISA